MTELQHALGVEVGESKFDEDNLPEVEDMVSVCAGLVTVDKESAVTRLVHYTTQEYFDRTREKWFPDAETDITRICVTYLSFDEFERGICHNDKEFEERLLLNPLYNYASYNWGHHAREASTVIPDVISFLKRQAQVEASSQALLAGKLLSYLSNYSQKFPRHMIGIHLAAYFGVLKVVQLLLSSNSLESIDSYGKTPLSYAAMNGHEAVVKMLLAIDGVNPDSKDELGQTPLWYAAKNGHEAVVKLLLVTDGVDFDLKNKLGWTPLLFAAIREHEVIVKLLLDTGKVNVNVKDTGGLSPLSYNASSGNEAIVKLLLDTGVVDVNAKDTYGYTPLFSAVDDGHEAVVKLLLDTGKVDVNAKDTYGYTPLSHAAKNGHEVVVKLLLDTGKVDINAKSNVGNTALSLAAYKGHQGIVKLLHKYVS